MKWTRNNYTMPENSEYLAAATKRFVEQVDLLIGWREGEKVTAKQICANIGILGTNLSRMRAGNGSVTVDAICRLCEVYGVSANYLITGKEDNPLSNTEVYLKRIEKALKNQQNQLNLLIENSGIVTFSKNNGLKVVKPATSKHLSQNQKVNRKVNRNRVKARI